MRIILLILVGLLPMLGLAQSDKESFSTEILDRGNMFISTTFSIEHQEGQNQTLLIQPLDDYYRLSYDITLRSGYFIKENFVLGGFFKYGNRLNESLYTVDNNQISNKKIERNFSIAPFIRNYLPLGNGRFCLFNETNLEFTYGRGVQQIVDANDVQRSLGTSYKLNLGIQPGISAFITEKVAFEVGTSLLGLSSSYTKTENNGNEEGYAFSNDVNFKIDLLSLFLGVTFYFPVNEK